MKPPVPPERRSAGGGTAAAIRSVRFSVTEPFVRGYDAHEVDRFQDHCAAVVEALSNGWLACSEQVDALRACLERAGSVSGDGAIHPDLESAARAELRADAERERALTAAECGSMIERARLSAAGIVEEAQTRAAALERQIDARAQRLARAADLARQEVNLEVAALHGAHAADLIPRPHGPARAVSRLP